MPRRDGPAIRPGVPATRWSAGGSRWRAPPLTIGVLVLGLWLFGTGEAALLASRLGNTPWTVLAEGLSRHTPLSIGGATLAISLTVLIAWVPLGERPGIGTIANTVIIAVAIDVMLPIVPHPRSIPFQLLQSLLATASIGVASALYLTANLGPGPRDGWMTGLHRRTGLPIARVRAGIEATVLACGWLLGGRVGVGTVLFALLIGHSLSLALRILRRTARPRPYRLP